MRRGAREAPDEWPPSRHRAPVPGRPKADPIRNGQPAMSDINLHGFDAMGHGALVALLAVLPSTLLFWSLTRGLAAGPRVLRPVITGSASLGLIALLGACYALAAEREGHEGSALAGCLLAGFVLQLLLCFLLLFSRRS